MSDILDSNVAKEPVVCATLMFWMIILDWSAQGKNRVCLGLWVVYTPRVTTITALTVKRKHGSVENYRQAIGDGSSKAAV